MCVDWSLYEKMMGSDCAKFDARVDAIVGAVDSFLEGIVDDPAYQKSALVEGDPTPLAVTRTASHQCSIVAEPSTDICIGDTVACLGEQWIVVELFTDKIGLLRGTMWLCNDVIRFQNHSPSVHTRHCVIDNGTYAKKSSDPDAFVMANTYKMYVPKDAETEKLFVDKRLSLGTIYDSTGRSILEVYKIIGVDTKTQNYGEGSHLMVVTLQRDVYNPAVDSLSDNLCDVYQYTDSSTTPAATGSCVINGKDAIRIGTKRKYTAVFTDAFGIEPAGIVPAWTVECPAGAVCEYDGLTCSIELPLDGSLVGDTIRIAVCDEDGQYGSFTKKVQVITVG